MAKQAASPVFEELSALTGDDIGAGYAGELALPNDDILRERGGGDIGLYEKVLTDPQCKSTFDQRRYAVTSREWHVEPGDTEPSSKAPAEDLRANLAALKWDLTTRKMLMAVWNGYSVAELMYGTDGTRIWIGAVKARNPRRFRFGRDGSLRLVTRGNPNGLIMPERKFWVVRVASENDDEPYGRGLGYYNYWPVWFKRNGFRYWSLFLQRFGSPTPVARISPGADEVFRQKVLRMLTAVITGGRVAIPNNIQLEFLNAVTSSGGDFQVFAQYLDEQISKNNLGQTMTTDNGSSLSQAQEHSKTKLEFIKSDADLVCESFNTGPAKWLAEWNHPGATPARTWRRIVEPRDLVSQASRDKVLFDMGWEATKEYVAETYGTGFTRRDPATMSPGFGAPGAPGASPSLGFAEPVPNTAIEEATEGDQWRRLLGPEIAELERLANEAGSLEKLRDQLGEYAKRDPDAITDSLARVMFAAAIAGETGADLGRRDGS